MCAKGLVMAEFNSFNKEHVVCSSSNVPKRARTHGFGFRVASTHGCMMHEHVFLKLATFRWHKLSLIPHCLGCTIGIMAYGELYKPQQICSSLYIEPELLVELRRMSHQMAFIEFHDSPGLASQLEVKSTGFLIPPEVSTGQFSLT